MAYRVNRNICKSIKDFITAQLIVDGWNGITVLKGASRVYDTVPPVITVRLNESDHLPIELGDNCTRRETLVFIDVYGSDSGIGLVEDLKDWLIEVLKKGVDYYEYVIVADDVHSKTKTGRVSFLHLKDSPINFDTDKSELNIRDKWRWLVTSPVATDKIET